MANCCFSHYDFAFKNEEDAIKFSDFIKKATSDVEVNKKGQGWGRFWLGNLLLWAGVPFSYYKEWSGRTRIRIQDVGFEYRGEIVGFWREENVLHIETESAWDSYPWVFKYVLDYLRIGGERYEVSFYAEEPGNVYYVASSEGEFEGDTVLLWSEESKYENFLTGEKEYFPEYFLYKEDVVERIYEFIKGFNPENGFVKRFNFIKKEDRFEASVKAFKRLLTSIGNEEDFCFQDIYFTDWLMEA